MQQEKLFYDTWRSALRHACLALGNGKLVPVAVRLWPSLASQPSKAEAKLANCLNPNHDWKLDLEEVQTIMQWAREEGVHCAMYQLCDDLTYTRPEIAPTKTPDQVLAEQMEHYLREFKRLADERAALTTDRLRVAVK